MKKCAIYARVSTKEQEEKNQIPAIKKIVDQRGFKIHQIYSESASAWKSGHQKMLKQLFQDAQDRDFQVLMVWALDRLTREGPAKILQLYKKLEDLGITVISVQEPWTEAPSEVKPLLLAVIGWVAEMESRRRSERTKAGIARKKQSGGKVGRKPGSKDKKKRSNQGYILRQAREKLARAEEEGISID